MQAEILAANPASRIRILAVNAEGYETGNLGFTDGRVLPLVQDAAAAAVWTNWAVTWRDVVILDDENRAVGVYNLTDHDLVLQPNYEDLLAILRSAAGE